MFILERVSELRSERGMSFQIWGPYVPEEKKDICETYENVSCLFAWAELFKAGLR